MDKYELNFTTTEIVDEGGVYRAVEIEGVRYKPDEVRKVEVDDIKYDVRFANGLTFLSNKLVIWRICMFSNQKKNIYTMEIKILMANMRKHLKWFTK